MRYHDLPGREPVRLFLSGPVGAPPADRVEIANQPTLTANRRLLVDLLGFWQRNKPNGFSYALDAHAAALAELLDHLGVRGTDLIAHSWAATLTVVLATQRPDLVRAMVFAEDSLGSVDGFTRTVSNQSEADYLHYGHAAMIAQFEHDASESRSRFPLKVLGSLQVAAPVAVYRGACALRDSASVAIRQRFLDLPVPRSYFVGKQSHRPDGERDEFTAAGVRYLTVANV